MAESWEHVLNSRQKSGRIAAEQMAESQVINIQPERDPPKDDYPGRLRAAIIRRRIEEKRQMRAYCKSVVQL